MIPSQAEDQAAGTVHALTESQHTTLGQRLKDKPTAKATATVETDQQSPLRSETAHGSNTTDQPHNAEMPLREALRGGSPPNSLQDSHTMEHHAASKLSELF